MESIVLSPALQVLFEKLASGEITEYLTRWNINELLIEKLKIAYFTNTAVLDDAEEKQYSSPAVETWLEMLKDSVHDAEDLLDELATQALKCKLEANSNQVRNWSFSSSSLNPFIEGIESRIENIIARLEYIAKQKDVLGLKGDGRPRIDIFRRAPSTPLLFESHVYGRNKEKEEIIKLLIANEPNDDDVSIIPIIGMGGLGKTTLAQIVYNDSRTDDHFDLKAWACVSDDFDVLKITRWILESATKTPCETMNLELLQNRLKSSLNKKKFLIVLDDIWNENYENWNYLQIPFMVGAPGSKIIVTTRNEKVLSVMNTLTPYRLKEMTDDDCWSLFLHHAFGKRKSEAHPTLVSIGRLIMNKCKGLPLAVKALGGLLGSSLETNCWNNILHSNIWDLPANKSSILPALILSYHHLPANLKRCFAYCSMFPKDYEFDRKEIVMLWMAEGFVQQVVGNRVIEQVGDEYFNDLLSRSFFQESAHSKSRYVMHDLINDLAQFVSRKMCIRLEDMLESSKEASLFEKARHLSYTRGEYDVFGKFDVLHKVKWLRTFLPLVSAYNGGYCYLTNKVPHDLIPNLKFLRVLSLSSYCITEIPDSFGNLTHLRYLDLSRTAIEKLPESLCMLYNLQTLMLYDCDGLIELPPDMGNLRNLRHFDISRTGLQKMPRGMGKWRYLQMLPEFIVGSDTRSTVIPDLFVSSVSGSGIGDLRDLLHLRGILSISNLDSVNDAWEARRASLTNKKHLTELSMEWSSDNNESRKASVETDVLEMLQPHQGLRKLTIKGYGGTRYPTWIGDPSFSKIEFLSLSDCKRCLSLPALGQLPSLRKLFIKGMSGLKKVGVEFYGGDGLTFVKPFPSLEVLSFKKMLDWEIWSSFIDAEEVEGFPNLLELYVEDCPKLHGAFPSYLPSMKKLVIHECGRFETSIPRLPNLHDLNLKLCEEVLLGNSLDLSSLVSLHIENILNLTHLSLILMQHLVRLEDLKICDCFQLTCLWKNDIGLQHLSSLRRLVIRNCPFLVCFIEGDRSLLTALQYLELENCHSLKSIPHGLYSLMSLGELTIKECPGLIFTPEMALPPMLKGLVIRGCGLESLSGGIIQNENSSLEILNIGSCYSLTSFTNVSEIFPTKLKEFTIGHCPDLQCLPSLLTHNINNSLMILEIIDCPSITTFPRGNFPATLRTLTIWSCTNLESLPRFTMQTNSCLESLRIGDCSNLKSLPDGLNMLTNLQYFEIDRCPDLVTFPNGGFPSANLQKIYINDCANLQVLPDRMQNLTSLQELSISNCPRIESFSEGGFPINLLSLGIKGCANITPLSEWGLHRLASLRKFSISGGSSNLASFPEWLLPPTLVSLHIENLPNLESLSNSLPNLNFLEELNIRTCHKLHSLPVEGLPATLARLEISHCPLLKRRCEKDWPKINHIPCILM